MNILLLNMTRNVGGWEDNAVNQLKSRIEVENCVRFTNVIEISRIPADLVNEYYDFVIVVAHGNNQGTTAVPGVQQDFNYAILAQLIPIFGSSHKFLLICQGANPDAISEFNIGIPNGPVDEIKVLISKMVDVTEEDVINTMPRFFTILNAQLSPGIRPSRQDIRNVANSIFDSSWLIIDGQNLEE